MRPEYDLRSSFRLHGLMVLAVTALLVIALGGWAAKTEFSGAVIASGQVTVDSNVKKVQHPTGGVVAELRIRDGQSVKAGEVLIQLDEVQTRANLAIVTKALDELAARQARQEAERDGLAEIVFPKTILERVSDPDVARVVDGELRQFHARRATRDGQKAQLKERIRQLSEEVTGYRAQIDSKGNQIEWIGKELVGIRGLWTRNLVPYTRLTSLERENERLHGERGQLLAAIAQVRGKMLEIEMQISQIDQDMRTEVNRDLAEIRGRTSELVEKKVSAEDQLQRIDIRSPQDGAVHQLSVHTVGGVVAAGEQIMLIVPEADALTIEARVQPHDIDQVRIGQPANIRLLAFNQQTTPEFTGHVSKVSADVSEDVKTGLRSYTVRIAVPEDEIPRLEGVRLVPGMPADVFIQTSSRTVISFLVRPLWDQISRAFRES